MADRLDEILRRGLAEELDTAPSLGLGPQVRRRATRRRQARRTAAAISSVVVIGIVIWGPGTSEPEKIADSLANAASVADVAADVDMTTRIVSESIERLRADQRRRILESELRRLESEADLSPLVDQTIALGMADAERLATTEPSQAVERLQGLVELFPNSALTSSARHQLTELQNQESIP